MKMCIWYLFENIMHHIYGKLKQWCKPLHTNTFTLKISVNVAVVLMHTASLQDIDLVTLHD